MADTDLLAVHTDPVVEYVRSAEGVGVRRVNEAFADAFDTEAGLAPDVALEETLASAEVVADVGESVAGATPLDRTVECETTDGARTVRLRNLPTDDGGYLVYTDVTDRAARERELATRNEQLEAFAGVVAHDLRNPIEIARTYLETARTEGDPAHFDRVDAALDRMGALVEDVLQLARDGQVIDETERLLLADAAAEAWAAVDTADATLAVADEDATLKADPDRLQQALENLFRNAIEHGDETVTVRVGTLADGDGFFVADDGPGIPPDDRDGVFDPGVTTAADGTGLGLSIVRRIVTAHGWEIAVTEGDQGGARFEVAGVESVQPF
ncbi:MAG: sensor histidine kinase [Haloarculaceae archaeon]